MKTTNILIPTDFSLASLTAVTTFLDKNQGGSYHISLVHFLQISDSISELLMLSRRNREYAHISSEFEEKLNDIRKQYAGQLAFIHPEFFYGSTIAVFKNYLEGKKINMILMLHGHVYEQLTENSIDPQLLVQRSGYPIVSISSAIKPKPVQKAARLSKLELELH